MARTEKIDVFYEKHHSGAWILSTVTDRRIHRIYFGYTKREATKLFRQYVREEMNS